MRDRRGEEESPSLINRIYWHPCGSDVRVSVVWRLTYYVRSVINRTNLVAIGKANADDDRHVPKGLLARRSGDQLATCIEDLSPSGLRHGTESFEI